MFYRTQRMAPAQDGVTLLFRRRLELDTETKRCWVDGVSRETRLGNWMFYLPDTGEKFFHAQAGAIDCIHPSRPANETLDDEWSGPNYSSADWRRALSTPLETRLAEIWIVTQRLWRAGLGPRPLGISFVEDFRRNGAAHGPTLGLVSENVERMRAKPPCDDAAMLAAGVQPDRIRGSIREQIRGYVVDLCSVVGAQPIDAADETARIVAWIIASRDAAPHLRGGPAA